VKSVKISLPLYFDQWM